MKRKILCLMLTGLLALSGCTSLLNHDYVDVQPHADRPVTEEDSSIVRVETYLPYEACSFILGHDFNRESLYQVLSKRDDTRVTHVTRICEARAADPEDAAVLGLKRGRPVHYFQTIGYNQSGKLIELSFAHYRGDQSRFRVELFRE